MNRTILDTMICPKDELIPVWEFDSVVLYACPNCQEFHHYKPKKAGIDSKEIWLNLSREFVRGWLIRIHKRRYFEVP